MIVVTNRGKLFEGRFDGKAYEFPTGEGVPIPLAAASYIFAYGKADEDRKRLLIKYGWQKNGTKGDPFGPEAAMKRLGEFQFREEADDAPAPKEKRKIERAMTGVNAMSKMVGQDGQRRPRVPDSPAVMIPGSTAPLAPPAA